MIPSFLYCHEHCEDCVDTLTNLPCIVSASNSTSTRILCVATTWRDASPPTWLHDTCHVTRGTHWGWFNSVPLCKCGRRIQTRLWNSFPRNKTSKLWECVRRVIFPLITIKFMLEEYVWADLTTKVGWSSLRVLEYSSQRFYEPHYCDVIMGAMASRITSTRLITQPFIQAQIKENIKAPRHWPLCGEFTGDRWIPRTNGQ